MDARTQMLLSKLLWGLDLRGRPMLQIGEESFDRWAERNGLPRSIDELERRELVETAHRADLTRVVRLAKDGVTAAVGGRYPPQEWERPWDGLWRFVVFDIPVSRGALRARVRRRLRAAHFGCLQRSVWLSPDPVPQARSELGVTKIDTKSLLVLEARPVGGEGDRDLVRAAWSFRMINRRYEHYFGHIRSGLPRSRGEALRRWRERENHLWLAAVRADPLLPVSLHPQGYLGTQAFERRRTLLQS